MLCLAADAALVKLFAAHRHTELVSAIIYQPHPLFGEEKWTLKQVQGNDCFEILVMCSKPLP